MFRRVVVGISGGVDSAVAALLLKRQGFDVCGAFMKNWDQIDEKGRCQGEADWGDAQWLCDKMDISLVQVNFVKEYWNDVFSHFLQEYEEGLTPNPDILCNRHIKFNRFFDYATDHLRADAISTGHYARSSFGEFLENYSETRNAKLLCPVDSFKDQTFFLSQISQSALRRTMFPLGALLKTDVKKIALDAGLDRIVKKTESTGICFVGKRNFSEFISEYIADAPGNFIDFDTGQIAGRHNGIHHWTVGQRSKISGYPKPFFILSKNLLDNTITVVAGTDHLALYSDIVYTTPPFWIDKDPLNNGLLRCSFRFQHTKALTDCLVFQTKSDGLLIKLYKPLRALTPGQFAVLFKDGECLGSARITKPGTSLFFQK